MPSEYTFIAASVTAVGPEVLIIITITILPMIMVIIIISSNIMIIIVQPTGVPQATQDDAGWFWMVLAGSVWSDWFWLILCGPGRFWLALCGSAWSPGPVSIICLVPRVREPSDKSPDTKA